MQKKNLLKTILGLGVILLIVMGVSVTAQPETYQKGDLPLTGEEPTQEAEWDRELEQILLDIEGQSGPAPISSDANLTDASSREIVAYFLEAYAEGETLDHENEDYLEMIERLEEHIDGPETPLTEQDITVSAATSKSSLREYGNAMGEILTTHSTVEENEIDALHDALERNDRSRLNPIKQKVEDLDRIIDEVRELEVPSGAVNIHLSVLNSLRSLRNNLNDMSYVFDDPIRALLAGDRYFTDGEELVKSFERVAAYFETQGVTFSDQEPGRAYTYMGNPPETE